MDSIDSYKFATAIFFIGLGTILGCGVYFIITFIIDKFQSRKIDKFFSDWRKDKHSG